MARETTWRADISSINYIETSTWTRQEHNGFSHQNPSFIGAVLNLKPDAARVYLPPDAVSPLSSRLIPSKIDTDGRRRTHSSQQ
jgi:xylulose-5-phosphate/fructose-6-phosphate phosphoketolase